MTLRMAGKRQDNALCSAAPTSATEECHMEQVCNISCMATDMEVRISAASVYCILTDSLGKRRVCAKWIPHVLLDDQRTIRIVLATTHLQCCRNEGNAFLHRILMADESWMHSLDRQLRRQKAEYSAQTSPRKKIAWRSQGAQKVMHITFWMNTHLQLIVYHIHGKNMWTVLVITLRRGHMCKHSGI